MPRKPTQKTLLPEGYTWPQLHRMVRTTLETGISVLLRGHPGVGKSTLAHAIADELGLPMIDIRLAQRDPADLNGVWFPDKDRQVLDSYPPAWAVRASKEPVVIFLDEINAAVTRLHQAAAYQIVLEKRVGDLQFHPDTVVMAAGNLAEDNAIVTPLSSALCNRFAHFVLRVDTTSWLSWANANGIDPSILGYIGRHGNEVLYDNADEEMAFPSPRSWEMASRVLQAADPLDKKRLVAACIGIGHAEKFFSWRRIYGRVNAAQIIRRGKTMDFTRGKSADPSFVYAATYAVAGWLRSGEEVSDTQLPNIVGFLRSPGLDREYAFLFLRQVRQNDALFGRLRGVPVFRDFAAELVALQASLYA